MNSERLFPQVLSDEGKLNFALSRLYSTALFTQDHKSFCFALLLLVHFIPLPNIPNKINFSILAHHDTIIEVNKAKCLNSPFNSKSFVNTLGHTEAFKEIIIIQKQYIQKLANMTVQVKKLEHNRLYNHPVFHLS